MVITNNLLKLNRKRPLVLNLAASAHTAAEFFSQKGEHLSKDVPLEAGRLYCVIIERNIYKQLAAPLWPSFIHIYLSRPISLFVWYLNCASFGGLATNTRMKQKNAEIGTGSPFACAVVPEVFVIVCFLSRAKCATNSLKEKPYTLFFYCSLTIRYFVSYKHLW